jgi:hypothetical protein
MASGLKDMGRFPTFWHVCEEASDGAYTPEAIIERSRSCLLASGVHDVAGLLFCCMWSKIPTDEIIFSSAHNRKVIVTASGLNGTWEAVTVGTGQVRRCLSRLRSVVPSQRRQGRSAWRERERERISCKNVKSICRYALFFSLDNSDSNFVVDRQSRCESCGKAAGFCELLVARNGLQCRVVETCVFCFVSPLAI